VRFEPGFSYTAVGRPLRPHSRIEMYPMYPKNILERFYVIQQNNFAATAVTRSSVRCVCCSKFLIHGALLSNYASAEQCSSDRSRGIKTISRQPVADNVTLAARSAEDRVQSGSADVQSPQHIDAIDLRRPIQDRQHTQPQPAIDHYDAVSTFHDDDFCEARSSMLCTDCLELTTENYRQ